MQFAVHVYSTITVDGAQEGVWRRNASDAGRLELRKRLLSFPASFDSGFVRLRTAPKTSTPAKLVQPLIETEHQLFKSWRKFAFRNRVIHHVQLLTNLALQRRFYLFVPESFQGVHLG
jgi:hypothetical protein